MFDKSYLDIETQLRSLDAFFASVSAPKIGTIAPFNDQYNPMVIEKDLPFKTPAVFVQFTQADWSDYSQLHQKGDVIVSLHVCLHRNCEGFETSRDKDKYMTLIKYPMLINAWMHGFSGEHFTGLLRRSDRFPIAPDMLYVHVINYATILHDDSASKLKKYILTVANTVDLDVEKKTWVDILAL